MRHATARAACRSVRFSAYCNTDTDTNANRAGDTPRRPSTGNQPTKSSSTNKSCNRSRINIAGVPFGLAAHATRAVSTGTTELEPDPSTSHYPSIEAPTDAAATRLQLIKQTKITNSIRNLCQNQFSTGVDKRRLEQSCPRLGERGHGTWYFHCSGTNLLGQRERARRGGYPSQSAARQARDEFLAGTAADRTAEGWTVERWLRHWLDSRTSIRPTTRFHYTRDVDTVLTPYLGRYRLADLDARLLRTGFAAIADTRNTKGRPQSVSAMHHLRTTLRAALNLAVKEGVLDCNPAQHIEIKGYQQPHAKVWTEARVDPKLALSQPLPRSLRTDRDVSVVTRAYTEDARRDLLGAL
jgi:hypothetical protein